MTTPGQPLTAHGLFEQLCDRLSLSWVYQPRPEGLPVLSGTDIDARPDLAGFLNLIHTNQIQVLGVEELNYLFALDSAERDSVAARLLARRPLVILVAEGLDVPSFIETMCEQSGVPLWSSPLPSLDLVNFLQHYLSQQIAQRVVLHGVFMEIFTIGVLITGDSGCGKSELALELLTRGHRLIADDAPEFIQISPDTIVGMCPEVLQDCLEVRGLGILNVRQMFGDSTIKTNKFLRLIINLRLPGESLDLATLDRLRGETSTEQVLALQVPRIDLPVLPGRNLAVIAEAAVRDFMLKMKGIDAASDFIERHNRLMHPTD